MVKLICPLKQYIPQYIFCSSPVPRCGNQILAVTGKLHPSNNFCRTRNVHLRSLCEIRWSVPNVQFNTCECVLLPECPNIVATHSPVMKSKMLMFLSEQLVATYWPDGSSCTCEDKRVRKESTLCANIGKENGLGPEMLPGSGFHPRSEIPCRASSVCHCWC